MYWLNAKDRKPHHQHPPAKSLTDNGPKVHYFPVRTTLMKPSSVRSMNINDLVLPDKPRGKCGGKCFRMLASRVHVMQFTMQQDPGVLMYVMTTFVIQHHLLRT